VKQVKELFPDYAYVSLPNVNSFSYDPDLASEVELQDGSQYVFKYTVYGELARVTLPSGGMYEYDWDGHSGRPGGNYSDLMVYRRLKERRVYASSLSSQTSYEAPLLPGTSPLAVTVKEKNEAGTVLRSTVHRFHGNPADSAGLPIFGYPDWNEGREYETEVGDGTTTALKRTHTWQQRNSATHLSETPAGRTAPNDPRITRTVTVLGAKAATTTVEYWPDEFNNVKKRCETGWDTTTSVRCTETSFRTDAAYTSPPVHLRNLLKSVVVTGSVQESEVQFMHDEYGTGNSLLKSYASISQHDPGRKESFAARGNVTTEKRWRNTEGAYVQRQMRFDIAGNVTEISDWPVNITSPLTPKTEIEWTDSFEGAAPGELTYGFATKITEPGNLTTIRRYDWNSGQRVSVTDTNGRETRYTWGDPFERVKSVTRPIGTTSVSYTATSVTSSETIGDGRLVTSTLRLDGLGRVAGRESAHGDGTVYTQTQYDALGRAWKQFTPGIGAAGGATTTTFDVLDRPLCVTYPGGATAYFSYHSNQRTQRDPAGKWMRYDYDALGRLEKVIESPAATLNACGQVFTNTDVKDFETRYTWDARDNLRTVTQGDRPVRQFVYNSLGQLTSAGNGETGLVSYVSDAAGNLVSRTDARGATTQMYDERGRVRTVAYPPGTPSVTYCYDGIYNAGAMPAECSSAPSGGAAKNLAGRLTMVTNGESTTKYSEYDAAGRVKASSQTTAGMPSWNFSYEWNDVGLAAITYPSGRKVGYTYDAGGQIRTVTSGTTTYASDTKYAPHGAPRLLDFGNGLREQIDYNSRLQYRQVQLGTAAQPAQWLSIVLDYGTTDNNGNVKTQTTSDSGGWSAMQSYTYDALNRLFTASEMGPGGWNIEYGYDRYGNQWVEEARTTGIVVDPLTPKTVNWFSADNRLKLTGYDAAGNQQQFNPWTVSYDAENRLQSAVSGNGTVTMTYDGEGRRVKRQTGTSLTYYVYDAFGHLAAEYTNVAGVAPCSTCYVTADHLGSVRAVSGTGGVVARYDYLPFGDAILMDRGNRSAVKCSTGTPGCYGALWHSYQRFTGKERDAETGLDYFGARYYSGAQGRFTSPDAPLLDQHPADPQSWNLFAYGRNNPLRFVDPTGNYVFDSAASEDEKKRFREQLAAAQAAANALRDKYGEKSKQYTSAARATASYGAEGVANGVTVAFGAPKTAGAGAEVTLGLSTKNTADNPTGQNILATFDPRAVSAGLIGHEGQHVADASDWIGGGYSSALNPTAYQGEFDATRVQLSIMEGQGNIGAFLGSGSTRRLMWFQGWPESNVTNTINGFLAIPRSAGGLYGLTPTNPRRLFTRPIRPRR
jgi:RHS repeat-associated protein